MHFSRHIKPGATLILDALDRGEDPEKTVPFGNEAKGSRAGKCQTFAHCFSAPHIHVFIVQARF